MMDVSSRWFGEDETTWRLVAEGRPGQLMVHIQYTCNTDRRKPPVLLYDEGHFVMKYLLMWTMMIMLVMALMISDH